MDNLSRKRKFISQFPIIGILFLILSFYVLITLSSFPLILLLRRQVSHIPNPEKPWSSILRNSCPRIPFSRAKTQPWFSGSHSPEPSECSCFPQAFPHLPSKKTDDKTELQSILTKFIKILSGRATHCHTALYDAKRTLVTG